MRAIDADALMTEFMDSDLDHLQRDDWKEVIQIVTDAPTITPEPHWIPVEQDLPKIGEYVLCETTERYFGKYHVCKFIDKDEWVDRPHFDWDRNGFPHVIAWTRFEPYKEVTE